MIVWKSYCILKNEVSYKLFCLKECKKKFLIFDSKLKWVLGKGVNVLILFLFIFLG